MRKSIFQLIIIAVLIVGMIGIIIVVKSNISISNNSEYYPSTNDTDNAYGDKALFDGYQFVEYFEHSFPVFEELKYAFTYFDKIQSYKEFEVDKHKLQVGDKVVDGTSLGSVNGVEVNSDCVGIVVTVRDSLVTIKVIGNLYAKFNYNIYDSIIYRIGDVFDIFKSGMKVAEAKIVDINYYEVVEDCIEVTILIDNSAVIFFDATYVEFSAQGYESRIAYAVRSRLLNITDNSYQVINKTYSYVCLKDKQVYNVDIEFGLSYCGYLEIKSMKCDYEDFDIGGGKLYAKSTA